MELSDKITEDEVIGLMNKVEEWESSIIDNKEVCLGSLQISGFPKKLRITIERENIGFSFTKHSYFVSVDYGDENITKYNSEGDEESTNIIKEIYNNALADYKERVKKEKKELIDYIKNYIKE